jgi:hypothetical protein
MPQTACAIEPSRFEGEKQMAYPPANNSKIKIPKNMVDRDIADANGFDVVAADGSSYTLVRNRPSNIKLVGHAEFLASLPPSRIAQAEAAVQILMY